MSMYDLMIGEYPAAHALLATLGYSPARVGRYRDCFPLNGKLIVFTRTGGGNRSHYEIENDALTMHQNYVRDWDWERDSTYALFEFEPAIGPTFARAVELYGERDPSVELDRAMAQLQSGEIPPDKQVKIDEFKQKLLAAIEGEGPGIIEV